MAICCIKDCNKPMLAKGMCAMHYKRVSLYGDPTKTLVKQLHGATLQERFDAYTQKGDGCWLWIGSMDYNGYGRLNVGNKPMLAHRLSWTLHCHEITSNQHVLHRCDTPQCVKPDHLFLGDQAANNADMMAKGRFHPGTTRGADHKGSKLTAEQVLEIRASEGASEGIGESYGISGRQVRDIRNRKSWRHLP